MNKKVKKVVQVVLFALIIWAFIFIGTKDFSQQNQVDNEKFDQEYKNVSKDNVFVYASANEIYTKLKSGTGVIFMGYPANVWSGPYANLLNEVAKQVGISEILYYDFKEDRDNQNGTYQSIVLRLKDYIRTLDTGKQNIYAPTLVMVKNGEIIAYDDETSINIGNITPEIYWNEYNTGLKVNHLKTMFAEYQKEENK